MSSLLELAKKYNTDKEWAHNYISDFYEEAFAPYREKDITLLEVGVQNGFSMKMWRDYFPNAVLWGLDVDDVGFADLANVNYLKANAYTDDAVNATPREVDILIDDGPHSFDSQIDFLMRYLPKLKTSGILVIEDIQSPVWPMSESYLSLFELTIRTMEAANNFNNGDRSEYKTKFVRTSGKAVSDSLLFVVERVI